MQVTFGPKVGEVVETFIDSLPGIMTQFGKESVEATLLARHEHNKKEIMMRYAQMPNLFIWNQGGNFLELLLEARTNYIEGKFWSSVAVCGMVVESLCKDIAKLRTDEPEFANIISEKFIHQSINCLKNSGCFWLTFTSKLMHDIMTARNDYIHVKKESISSPEVLNILVRTSLVVVAEFGFMPGTPGKVARISPEYFKRIASTLNIPI